MVKIYMREIRFVELYYFSSDSWWNFDGDFSLLQFHYPSIACYKFWTVLDSAELWWCVGCLISCTKMLAAKLAIIYL